MEQESLADLNALAQVADALSSDNMKKLGAVVTLAKPQTTEQIKNLLENLDLFDFAPGTHSPVEYGKYMIQQTGHFDYDENLEAFYDYEGYALQRMNEEDGMFTDRGYMLRKYLKDTERSTGKFISLYSQAQPITPEEYRHLMHLRMENTGKVTGVFDLNFDKREFSAVHTIEGWKTWAMQDVSTAVYRAAQKQLVSGDVMLQKLLECLNGKGITSAGHLSARNFSFGEEIIESDGKLNFYLQADFDVDAAFGTFVCTDENDDWLNIYANYDIAQDKPCDTLELNLCKGDGTEENWSYHLNAAEQEVLARKMEAFCQQQTGMSLHEYAQQLRESRSQTPEIQM